VTNSGSISTTGGQAALIAGIGVDFGYLPDPSNGSPTLMPSGGTQVSITPSGHTNLLQFFNTGTIINAKGVDKTPVGHLTNSGIIETPRGNITLLAGTIEQDGVLLASTSVKRPGSIYIAAYYESTPYQSTSTGLPLNTDSSSLTGPCRFRSKRLHRYTAGHCRWNDPNRRSLQVHAWRDVYQRVFNRFPERFSNLCTWPGHQCFHPI
jgi:hypothetical protein